MALTGKRIGGEMFGIIKWIEKQLDAAGQRVAAKSELNNGLEGQFVKTYICVDCGEELTWKEKMGSLGCCPYCGHTVPGTIVETHEATKKQIKKKWKRIPWRNETPEQKAFGWGIIFGYIGCLLSFLMAEWTISWMAL